LLLPSRATNKGASGIEQGERKSCKVYLLFFIEQLRNAGFADENFLVSERYRATLSAQLIFLRNLQSLISVDNCYLAMFPCLYALYHWNKKLSELSDDLNERYFLLVHCGTNANYRFRVFFRPLTRGGNQIGKIYTVYLRPWKYV